MMREYLITIPYVGHVKVCDAPNEVVVHLAECPNCAPHLLPSGVTEEAFRERLRLELDIRRLGLR